MRLNEIQIQHVLAAQIMQQSVKQISIRARCDRQMQVRNVASRGATRIDYYHAHFGSRLLRCNQTLIEHRMRPGIVGTRNHNQLCGLHVFIAYRHRIGTEGALLGRHCRRHAKPRICIDIGAADKTFHQLVGDVIILGQDLAGNVKSHRIRPMLGDDAFKFFSDAIQRNLPRGALPADLRVKQAPCMFQRIGQSRALGTQPPITGRMQLVADQADALADFHLHPATHPAIRAGSQDCGLRIKG